MSVRIVSREILTVRAINYFTSGNSSIDGKKRSIMQALVTEWGLLVNIVLEHDCSTQVFDLLIVKYRLTVS